VRALEDVLLVALSGVGAAGLGRRKMAAKTWFVVKEYIMLVALSGVGAAGLGT
jgi:hypothetical protein